MKSSFHTHCCYCDGAGSPSDIVEEALSRGFSSLGFSSHSPADGASWALTEHQVDEYIFEINQIKEKYKDQIEIYLGMEVEFLWNESKPSDSRFQKLGLDYIIASFHMWRFDGELYAVDGPFENIEFLISQFGSIKKLVKKYYESVTEMANGGMFDFIGHFDLIKKHNKHKNLFDESSDWYKKEVIKCLDAIAELKCKVEINTGGMSRDYTDSFYPSHWIVEQMRKRNIPIVLNSDSHKPEWIDWAFDESKEYLKECGYNELWTLADGNWIPYKI